MDLKELKKKRLEILQKIDKQKRLCDCKESNDNCKNCESVAFLGHQLESLKNREGKKIIKREEFSIDVSKKHHRKGLIIEKDEYERYKQKGLSDVEVSSLKNVSISSLKNWKRKVYGSASVETKKGLDLTKEMYLGMKEKQMSDAKIAIEIGVSNKVLHRWKTENNLLGVAVAKDVINLSLEHYTKLNNDGVPDKDIAVMLGCEVHYIKNWKRKHGIKTRNMRNSKKQLEKGVI